MLEVQTYFVSTYIKPILLGRCIAKHTRTDNMYQDIPINLDTATVHHRLTKTDGEVTKTEKKETKMCRMTSKEGVDAKLGSFSSSSSCAGA